MAKSKKLPVIAHLFAARWDLTSQTLSNSVVTQVDIQEAIHQTQSTLSNRNAANFCKDFIRSADSGNRNFPEHVFQCGYTLRQTTGDGNSFEFIRVPEGQTTPFVARFKPDGASEHLLETLSLPIASRRLGRSDEAWLIQVIVRLRVLETHLAMHSPHNFVQLDHLQMAVKLRKTEVDALFLGTINKKGTAKVGNPKPNDLIEYIITCEAKGLRDDILEDQLKSQIFAMCNQKLMPQETIIPTAVKAVGKSKIFVIEFKQIERSAVTNHDSIELDVASKAVYELTPPLPGIGK